MQKYYVHLCVYIRISNQSEVLLRTEKESFMLSFGFELRFIFCLEYNLCLTALNIE